MTIKLRDVQCYLCGSDWATCMECMEPSERCFCVHPIPEFYCHLCKCIFTFNRWEGEDMIAMKSKDEIDAELEEIVAGWIVDAEDPFDMPLVTVAAEVRTPPKAPPAPLTKNLGNRKPPKDVPKPKLKWEKAQYGDFDRWVSTYESSYKSPYAGSTYQYVQKCRHYMEGVTLPHDNKTVIYCSSQFNHRKEGVDPFPDFGVYFASSWEPKTLAYYVPWTDHGTPKTPAVAAEALIEAWLMALGGKKVEIGCIGGHGRTGTALACFAVLDGLPAKEAVEWVRRAYCKEAIESQKQEWWVEWFEAYALGMPLPEEPVWYTPPSTYSKTSVTTNPPNPYKKPEQKALPMSDAKGEPTKDDLDDEDLWKYGYSGFAAYEGFV